MAYKKLAGAVLGAGGLVLFYIVILPAWLSAGVLSDQIENQRLALDKKQKLVDKVADLKEKVTGKRNEINRLASILPQDKELQSVVVNLEDIAKTSGIQIKTLKTGLVGLEGVSFKTIQAEVAASGQYSAVVDFIKSLEKNLRIFDLQQVVVSLDDSSVIPGNLNLEIKFNTYFVE